MDQVLKWDSRTDFEIRTWDQVMKNDFNQLRACFVLNKTWKGKYRGEWISCSSVNAVSTISTINICDRSGFG